MRLADLLTRLRVAYLPAALASVARVAAAAALLGHPDLITALLAGGASETTQANDALARLASRVRDDERLREAFAGLDPVALGTFVRESPAADGFRTALGGFLAEFGHRETGSLLLPHDPTWGSDPAVVLELVSSLVDARRPGSSAVADAALAELDRHPLVRLVRWGPGLRRLASAGARGYAVREDTHFELTRLMPPMAALAAEVGRRLWTAGALEAADDVWWLTWDEIASLPAPDNSSGSGAIGTGPGRSGLSLPSFGTLRDHVAAQKAKQQALAGSPLINLLSLHPPRPVTDALCVGTAGGGGRASGPVRVVRTPEDFGTLRPGEVLVCPATNPSWTPLFLTAAAVVVDHGGPASHAAIVAREYGLPAVMGTGDGKTVLTDGRRVLVDGDAGIVRADE